MIHQGPSISLATGPLGRGSRIEGVLDWLLEIKVRLLLVFYNRLILSLLGHCLVEGLRIGMLRITVHRMVWFVFP